MLAVCFQTMFVRHPCYFLRAYTSDFEAGDGAFVSGQHSLNVVLRSPNSCADEEAVSCL